MSISNGSILIGTAISAVGGTGTSFLSKGNTLLQHNTALDDGSSLGEQKRLNFVCKEPKISSSAPAGYTQARNIVTLSIPKTLSNGNSTLNTVRLEMSVDRESTVADRNALREIAAQILIDVSFDDFWEDQSVA